MKKMISGLAAIFCMSLAFARTAPMPDWVRDYRKAYPNSQYIAQRGSGKSAEDAKTDAVSQLSRYFKSTVNANLSTTMTAIDDGDSVTEELRVVDDVSVASEVEFFGLEITESYYHRPEKKWYAVAYINRDEAWAQYKPKIDAARNRFQGFVKKAEAEADSIRKIGLYKSAWKESMELMEKLEYGRIISPEREAAYSDVRDTVSGIPSKIKSEQGKLTATLDITGDYGKIVEVAVRKALGQNGFVFGNQGNYSVKVEVTPNATGSDPLAITPSVVVTVSSVAGDAAYSFEESVAERTVAYTLEGAQKKAYPKLAEKIENGIKF